MHSNLTKSDAQWKRMQSLRASRVSTNGFANRTDARIFTGRTFVRRHPDFIPVSTGTVS